MAQCDDQRELFKAGRILIFMSNIPPEAIFKCFEISMKRYYDRATSYLLRKTLEMSSGQAERIIDQKDTRDLLRFFTTELGRFVSSETVDFGLLNLYAEKANKARLEAEKIREMLHGIVISPGSTANN